LRRSCCSLRQENPAWWTSAEAMQFEQYSYDSATTVAYLECGGRMWRSDW
jgi:hypothetical protein